jgi:hypothetical protein
MTTNWHLDVDELDRYGQGRLEGAALWSVEAHLSACSTCREQLSVSASGLGTERVWQRIEVALDQPRPSPVEWVLLRIGVPEHLARLLVATPALRLSWLTAVALTFGLGVAVGWAGESEQTPIFLLALVPLVAVIGVAAAFGPRVDPTFEIGLVAPFDTFRLLLLRSAAVLTATVALAGMAAFAAPDVGLRTLAWLAPALLLTGVSLALSSVLGPVPAATVAGVIWLVVLASTVRLSANSSVLFDPSAQAVMGIAAVAAAFAVAVTRGRFDTSRTFDNPRRVHQ